MTKLIVQSVEAQRPERFGGPLRERVRAERGQGERGSILSVEFLMPRGSLKVGDEVEVEIPSVGVALEPDDLAFLPLA